MTAAPPVYAQARAETAAMLGYDLASLTAEQATRLDVAAALRLAVDDQSGKLARGETADVTKLLSASEALARLLPPLREPPPPTNREDPRDYMWRTYSEMRRRGADVGQGYDGALKRIAALEAEIAALKAGAHAPDEPGASTGPHGPVGGTNSPVGDNVVPLARQPRARVTPQPPTPTPPPPTPTPPPPAAASAVFGDLVAVVDPSPDESWRNYVEPDGSIRSTPFSGGKYWGPV